MDADKDDPSSLNSDVFKQDYLNLPTVAAQRAAAAAETLRIAALNKKIRIAGKKEIFEHKPSGGISMGGNKGKAKIDDLK